MFVVSGFLLFLMLSHFYPRFLRFSQLNDAHKEQTDKQMENSNKPSYSCVAPKKTIGISQLEVVVKLCQEHVNHG